MHFRWACNKHFHNAVTRFVDDSRHASPWAAQVYARPSTAVMTTRMPSLILARAWIRVIYRCWNDGVAYDPSKHGNADQLRNATAAT